MSNKVIITIVVIVVSACVLLSAGLIVGGAFLLRAQKNYNEPTTVVVVPGDEPTTAAPTTGTTETPAVDSGLSSEVLAQMDEIQRQVSEIRGLPQKSELVRDLMTPEELNDTVVNDFFKDYTEEDAASDTEILSRLGLLESDFNLLQFYLDLYSEQIAGFYDSETKEMYVIAGEGFGGTERMTYAHEFNHALQDQTYDLENGLKLNDDYCETDTEYCAAVSALIEGDSTTAETFWFYQYATDQDRQDVFSFQEDYSSPVYDSAPAYMKEDFLFPYIQGQTFVQSLLDAGGWDAVDAAYANLPVTTEQILHPEKYPEDKPVAVDIPDLSAGLEGNWEEVDRNVMGEWYTYLILARGWNPQFVMEDDDAKEAAAGWGGDTYVYYSSTENNDYLFAWRSTWEGTTDTNDYYDLSRKYGLARWGIPDVNTGTVVSWTSASDGKVTIRRSGSDVLWLMGSTDDLVDHALEVIGDF